MKYILTIFSLLFFLATSAQKIIKHSINAKEVLSDTIAYPDGNYQGQVLLGDFLSTPVVKLKKSVWANSGDDTIVDSTCRNIVFDVLQARNTFYLWLKSPVVNSDDYFLQSVEIEITELMQTKSVLVDDYVENSVLATGDWVKVKTNSSGIHKITYGELEAMGINNPEAVAVYGNGGYMLPKMNNVDYYDDLELNSVLHATDANNEQCIFFYVPGTTKWSFNRAYNNYQHQINLYSESSYYYLTDDLNPSPAITEAINTEASDTTLENYIEEEFIEEELSNLIKTGRQFFGDLIVNGSSKEYTFSVAQPKNGGKAKLRISAAARSSASSYFIVSVNDEVIDSLEFSQTNTTNQYASYARPSEKIYEIDASNSVTVRLQYKSRVAASAYVDFISLNIESDLALNEEQLSFQNYEGQFKDVITYKISDANSNTVVWDVSNFLTPKEVGNGSMVQNGILSFNTDSDPASRYIAFDTKANGFPGVSSEGVVPNQNIHGNSSVEMIIVTHDDFYNQALELAEFHREEDDMEVILVTLDQVYNEFSSGLPDVSAIRNMTRMFYKKYSDLRYLLLMGDGHYNNRNFDGTYSNYIPTYQTASTLEPLSSYTSDDFFALLDDNEGETTGLIDIGVGRITCKTEREATAVVDKILNYSNSSNAFGDWRNVVCFIADDEDSHTHMEDSETLINLVDSKYSGFFTDKIYFDSYEQVTSSGGDTYPEVNEAITRRVEDGALLLNYIGHANPTSMADEDVLSISEVNSWSNFNSLPIFVTATCEFSRFDGDDDSAGERVLLNPSGGGVGLFSTTRVVYSSPNFVLSKNFYNNVFGQYDDGTKYRLGDIMRFAKNATTIYSVTNKRCFALLSDPALKLSFPKYVIKTDSINGVDPNLVDLTVGALEKVEIKGSVVDTNDETLTDFNGEVQMILYDKEVEITTMNNDNISSGAFTYNYRDNIIYKGAASVSDGKFNLSFIVPKDISYSIGKGKIYYYAVSGNMDANGSTENINIGGSGNNPVLENDSPMVEVYMNDRNFEDGGNVASSTLLLIDLFDESGINTVGAGIGHDLVGILDGDYNNPIILNDYYASEANSYQKGTIRYPMSGLEVGEHTLLVKVWDVQNNSANAEIKFTVEDGYKVEYVQNWPNPVVSYTDFVIKHNLPGEVFDATVDIYQLNGNKVATIEGNSFIYDALLAKVRWTLSNDNIARMNQILVYKIIVANQAGEKAIGIGKLVLSPD